MDRILEEWRPVVGFEGLYEVSSYGRVRSLDRWVAGPHGSQRQWKGRILRPVTGSHGYVTFNIGGKSMCAHVLIAAAFIGPRPDGHYVRHLDDNKGNNLLSNIGYGLPKDNAADALRNGRRPLGSQRPNAKITEQDALAIRASSASYGELADMYGIGRATLSSLKNGKTWKHV